MSPMRRLLMVAYTFPPIAGVGIERSLKHARYLPEHGWQPVIVAPANPGYRLVDTATLDRIPVGTEVHRAPSVEPAHLRRLVGRLLQRGSRKGQVTRPTPGDAPPSSVSGVRGLLDRAWRVYVELAFFPDEQIGWAPAAIAAGWRAHKLNPVDAIYSSGPPWTCHLIGASLKRITGVPWVADYRDPWVGNAYAAPLPAPYRAARAALEGLIIQEADAAVFASDGVRAQYATRYPAFAGRFTTIHNGYDLEDITAVRRPQDPRVHVRFRLIYTGSLQYPAEFRLLVDGIEVLLARRPELRDRLRVQLVGWLGPGVQALAAERLPSLAPVVEKLGFQPKLRTLELLDAADAALLVLAAGAGRAEVPSAKLFDYLGMDVPVLAVAPQGEVRRILGELDWGIGVDPRPEALAAGVERLMAQPRDGRLADPQRRFERRALSGRLASLLADLTP